MLCSSFESRKLLITVSPCETTTSVKPATVARARTVYVSLAPKEMNEIFDWRFPATQSSISASGQGCASVASEATIMNVTESAPYFQYGRR
jgi:hypothetical protein